MSPETPDIFGWDRLRHGGLLLDPPRLRRIADRTPGKPLSWYLDKELRRQAGQVQDGTLKPGDFVAFVLQEICGFTSGIGTWHRGSSVTADWARQTVTGEAVKPRHLWRGDFGATLPVFIDTESKLGIGRGTRAASQTLQWLRAGKERLAILTNGRQWRLVFAGLDFDAWCQWDVDLWFEEGALAPQVTALRTLLQPALWTPEKKDATPALLQAILDSRKGQAELSAVLGERVREAVELLVQSHGEVLTRDCADVEPPDIYRAAVRVVMRMVVVLFAESREKLLPRDNAFYHGAYGLTGLREELDKVASRSGSRLKRSDNAWPRVLALFRLVFKGSHHPDLPVPEYGGELFAPGDSTSTEGLVRALAVFETACFEHELLFPDSDVHQMLDLLTRTKVRIRQGRSGTWAQVPVDFSDLSSEYIGILYEGLLDFELKTAPPGDPIIFLAVGNQPALPLSRLEGMDDKAVANLLEKMKDTSGGGDDEEDDRPEAGAAEDSEDAGEDQEDEDEDAAVDAAAAVAEDAGPGDDRFITRTRAEEWARHAVVVGKLLARPRAALTAQKKQAWDDALGRKARQIVTRVVLPGEWYLVRWGGTRKGSGTFYTRPGLAVPTVHRTLRPLAYEPPLNPDGQPDLDAAASAWTPRTPEEILALKVCDPACGSGTFPVAALRFLTEALYASLHHHGRISETGDRAIVRLLDRQTGRAAVGEAPEELLGDELLPCRPSDDTFEGRLKAILRRHVVERCIYGVDLDPLAVELCRLSLWIETMDRDLPFSFLDHKIKCGNSLVGAWFDTYQHYPVMAWKNREGGDKGHSNGVHFEKDARTKVIKAFVKGTLTPDLLTFLRGRTLFDEDLQERATQAHGGMLATLSRLHALPVHAGSERARVYRDEVIGSPGYRSLKAAMDLWCACWFWPVGEIAHAPRPTTLAAPPEETRAASARVAARKRFLHWELEFPDVFNAARSGFDAVLGNPPWENLQPNPEEFFSNEDPLFRTYGRSEKHRVVEAMFITDPDLEQRWLDYSADFASFSHWIGASRNPFGDPAEEGETGFFALGQNGKKLHEVWRTTRVRSPAYSSRQHPFRLQLGRIFTYKLFLELSHALLREHGRLGQIVPSGIYSDSWSRPLRQLFLDQCRWEWLFSFENRDRIFEIHRSFKFNPVIVEKGGKTRAIKTAFMRRRLEDWESAEALVTLYDRDQVDQFSPRSNVILEIQSQQDLAILGKIYANSVLIGDDRPDGWGVRYKLEFMMNTDAHLFPSRLKWEAEGYLPDEYSRWLKGDWRPMSELWSELGIDPSRVVPTERESERRLSVPEVNQQMTSTLRCARPPYDRLPIPRADIPAGVILSREADAYVREEKIENVALPLYQGIMVQAFMPSARGWISGTGLTAQWDHNQPDRLPWNPQYLMAAATAAEEMLQTRAGRIGYREVARSTDARSFIGAVLPQFPCGHKVPVLAIASAGVERTLAAAGLLNSLTFDWLLRRRLGAAALAWYVLTEASLPTVEPHQRFAAIVARLNFIAPVFAPLVVQLQTPMDRQALTVPERLRLRVILDAVAASAFGLSCDDLQFILAECDHPAGSDTSTGRNPRGFWRVDKDKDPELRHTVLTLVAFADLEAKIDACGGDREMGIEAFLNQNDGEGWMLPETLRLADYGLGHDERAKVPQPVASRLGPRFYDWQLAQTAEESWRECELHARNLGGLAPEVEPALDTGRPMPASGQAREHGSRTETEGHPSQPVLFPVKGKE